MIVRAFGMDDYDAVMALWIGVGLHLNSLDGRAGLARKLEREPDLFLVADDDGAIVGSVLGSYDGRRGWINRLAVAARYQGRGVARLLMDEVERRLRARGCAKVNLHIERSNSAVQDFYEHLGYARDDLIFMEKWLERSDDSL